MSVQWSEGQQGRIAQIPAAAGCRAYRSQRKEAIMSYPRPGLGRRSVRGSGLVVLAAAAAFVTISAGTVSAAARPTPAAPSESALIHRLDTCLRPGQAKPTVVLIHGAWADASSWRGEVATLQAAGYDARAIANPVQNLTTDSQYVADYLRTLHGPVVLVGHSYGGSVITNAAAGLANVKALVYVDAAAPAPGQTTGQLSGAGSIMNRKKPSQLFLTTTYPGAPGGASEVYLKENIFVKYFGSDLPASEARLLWASQRGASTQAFTTPSTRAAWKTIPSWYFISTGDQIITAASELEMAHRAHSHITLFHGGSHLTLISHPNAVTAVIASAICSRH
jgi:pimeloyl-ACP methyl ester carboxylesterase